MNAKWMNSGFMLVSSRRPSDQKKEEEKIMEKLNISKPHIILDTKLTKNRQTTYIHVISAMRIIRTPR